MMTHILRYRALLIRRIRRPLRRYWYLTSSCGEGA